jgi:hypothetical protein
VVIAPFPPPPGWREPVVARGALVVGARDVRAPTRWLVLRPVSPPRISAPYLRPVSAPCVCGLCLRPVSASGPSRSGGLAHLGLVVTVSPLLDLFASSSVGNFPFGLVPLPVLARITPVSVAVRLVVGVCPTLSNVFGGRV